jgi:hypothetical protein
MSRRADQPLMTVMTLGGKRKPAFSCGEPPGAAPAAAAEEAEADGATEAAASGGGGVCGAPCAAAGAKLGVSGVGDGCGSAAPAGGRCSDEKPPGVPPPGGAAAEAKEEDKDEDEDKDEGRGESGDGEVAYAAGDSADDGTCASAAIATAPDKLSGPARRGLQLLLSAAGLFIHHTCWRARAPVGR